MEPTDEVRRERWEERGDLPLTGAAVLFLVAYALPILDPDLAAGWLLACRTVAWGAWALFAVDYAVRLALSVDRAAFVRANVFDLLVVLLPLLRPLRLLRLVTLLSVLNRHAGSSLRGQVAVYVAGASGLVVLVASLGVLDAERDAPDATITTFGDALWWSVTTVTTAGYGDLFPVTTSGRFVAVGLMLCGIALIGVVTASFASWLIERVSEVEEEAEAATRRDIAALGRELQALRAELALAREERRPD